MPAATANLHLRIAPVWKRLLQQAAKATNASTLTEYVLRSAVRQAQQDLLEQSTFFMKGSDWDAFNRLLEEPPQEIPALRKLAKSGDVFARPLQRS